MVLDTEQHPFNREGVGEAGLLYSDDCLPDTKRSLPGWDSQYLARYYLEVSAKNGKYPGDKADMHVRAGKAE